MSPSPVETEVVVVGAGPVGLFAAVCLSELGVRVEIVDKYQRAALHSYALALHPHTLELLDGLGMAQRLIDLGHRVDRVAVYRDARVAAEIDLGAAGGQFPFVLVVPQTLFEAALEERLQNNGVNVRWGHVAMHLQARDDGVRVVAARPEEIDGEERDELHVVELASDFAIGADGFGSFTARVLQVDYAELDPPLHYALLEFRGELDSPRTMTISLAGDTTDVLWPLATDHGRWGLQLRDESQAADVAELHRLLRQRAPWFPDDFDGVEWITTVCFKPRLASPFGRGRVWLAGDSAHVTHPVGIQSMNVGLRESHDLARRIAEILRGRGGVELLRYYNEDRRKEWRRLLGLSTDLETLRGAPTWATELGPRLVAALPASRHELNPLLKQIGLHMTWTHRK